MPSPRTPSAAKSSPVPAYNVLTAGAASVPTARQETAMFATRSVFGVQLPPPSVVFQIPPATPPANMVFGWSGSASSARVLPPTLPGPSCVQALRPDGLEDARKPFTAVE